MGKQQRIFRRDAVWYFRAKVPDDIRETIGKTEIRVSLGTSDHSEARKLANIKSVEVDELFAKARGRASLSDISDEEIRRLAREWFYRRDVDARDNLLKHPVEPIDRDEAIENIYGVLADLTGQDDTHVAEQFIPIVDGLLEQNGIKVDRESKKYWRLLHYIVRGEIEVHHRIKHRIQGNFHHKSDDKFFDDVSADGDALTNDVSKANSASTSVGVTLSELIQKFVGDPQRAKHSVKTKSFQRAMFRDFAELLGSNRPVKNISRDDCRQVFEVISNLPRNASQRFPNLSLVQVSEKASKEGLEKIHPKTVNHRMAVLGSLLKFAVEEGIIDWNPATKIRALLPRTKPSSDRHSFSSDQLNKIFQAPLYVGCIDDERNYAKPGPNRPRRGRFWVPLLSLFSGMRLNECCQLLCSDIEVASGIDIIRVCEDDDGEKRIKSVAADRVIPIHPELSRIGFMQFVEQMRAEGNARLFPEILTKQEGGYLSDPFSKWFGRFLKKIDAKTPKTNFHSFRHNFRDAMRDAQILEETVNALMGWAEGQKMSARYGSGIGVKALYFDISKVQFPKMEIDHLLV